MQLESIKDNCYNENMENLSKMLIPLIVIVAFITGFVVRQVIPEKIPGTISLEQASIKGINYLNQDVFKGRNFATIIEAENTEVYKVKFKNEGQDEENEFYITKDGKTTYVQGASIPGQISDSEIWTKPEPPKTDKPRAELFIMSFCPYGNMAEELMIPVNTLLGEKANIEVHYVIYSNYRGGGPEYCLDEENKYCSMHGIQELNQGVRELCVQKYQKDKFWDFLTKINNQCDYKNVDSCWEGAGKEIGIDINQIKSCQKNEALDFLAGEVERNQRYGISGSPQLIINGVEYLGLRNVEAYKKGICSAFISPPFECSLELESEGGAVSGGCQ